MIDRTTRPDVSMSGNEPNHPKHQSVEAVMVLSWIRNRVARSNRRPIRNPAATRSRRAALAWLFTVAHHKVYDAQKRVQRHGRATGDSRTLAVLEQQPVECAEAEWERDYRTARSSPTKPARVRDRRIDNAGPNPLVSQGTAF